MSPAELDRRNAQAREPQRSGGNWDRKPEADRLTPSEGGGCSGNFRRAGEATQPLQQPVGGCPSAPKPTENIFERTNRVREEAAGLREPAAAPPPAP